MMATAQRHGEFVADLEAKTSGLRKPHMVGIAGLPGTNQAGLPGDEAEVGLVAMTPQLWKGQHALVDFGRFGLVHRFWDLRSGGRQIGLGRHFACSCLGCPDVTKFGLKGFLDPAGVVSAKRVLDRQTGLSKAVQVLAHPQTGQVSRQPVPERSRGVGFKGGPGWGLPRFPPSVPVGAVRAWSGRRATAKRQIRSIQIILPGDRRPASPTRPIRRTNAPVSWSAGSAQRPRQSRSSVPSQSLAVPKPCGLSLIRWIRTHSESCGRLPWETTTGWWPSAIFRGWQSRSGLGKRAGDRTNRFTAALHHRPPPHGAQNLWRRIWSAWPVRHARRLPWRPPASASLAA